MARSLIMYNMCNAHSTLSCIYSVHPTSLLSFQFLFPPPITHLLCVWVKCVQPPELQPRVSEEEEEVRTVAPLNLLQDSKPRKRGKNIINNLVA